ncbi:DUF2834 domain-containing protein [Aliiroseovarius sp. F20344]|uniref:DUF2834 domain-containing protein n=1 Tax=Aliiroseovarius sp. F20344 TaxID=2926414 RepID=UPI001FF2DAEF|nr:DUF2834 domain-containing protein [Aliiroseovarius sp. F20344]MCK0140854.1 DUF2834 domain-containing protein [Aliiroseovarius sp. F20344]
MSATSPSVRKLYLVLAVIGAIAPYAYFIAFFAQNGLELQALYTAWGANLATKGLGMDLLFSAIALTIWIVIETLANRNWPALWAIPATFLIGVSCGLPLYLFLRSRPV